MPGKLLLIYKTLTFFFLLSVCSLMPDVVAAFPVDGRVTIPLGGNTWLTGTSKEGGEISDKGIENWTNKKAIFTVYTRLAQTGMIRVSLQLSVPEGHSRIRVKISGQSKDINAVGDTMTTFAVGDWNITDTGYIAIQLQGISKSGVCFADVSNLVLEGSAINKETVYVKNNEGNFFHWGRRGPSVHLNYSVPDDIHVEWFYNEVTVPKGRDVLGSYFMANGFNGGYFGMQVNSATERHILFSVWSPFTTDHPEEIPDDQRIELLRKGSTVHVGEFGNEGSGGQGYMHYPWKAGVTYRFLLQGKPDGKDHTVYTAYFYSPEETKWLLIASFRRPKTTSWLKHLYSFLENFLPDYGDKERSVMFGNQWIRTDNGRWMELNKARFTADNTGRKNFRMDYGGGIKRDDFYLRNCGFFNNYTPIDTWFETTRSDDPPQIDLEKLP